MRAIERAGIVPERVDEAIMGNVLSAGLGQTPARAGGIGGRSTALTVAAVTINKVCGSGLKAVMLADQAIPAPAMPNRRRRRNGKHEAVPYLLARCRSGWRFGNQQAVDSMQYDGLWCAFENCPMGNEADYIAASRAVDRADQDEFALESHRRAVLAAEQGLFKAEIVPVTLTDRKQNEIVIDRDEGPRGETTLAVLLKATAVVCARRNSDAGQRVAN